MNVREALKVARERWVSASIALLIALIAGLISLLVTPPTYQSSITFYVAPSAGAENLTQAYQGSLLSQQQVKSYAALLTGDRVSAEVAHAVGGDMTPDQVKRETTTSVQADTVLVTAQYDDQSPQRAAALANAAGASLVRLAGELEASQGPRPSTNVNLKIVQPAQVPANPISPQPSVNMGLAVVLGILLAAAVAYLRHRSDNTIRTESDVKEAIAQPILAYIPVDEALSSRGTSSGTRKFSLADEQFRQLRTALSFTAVDKERKCLLICSAMPGEGKTTTACNLAFSLAEAGYKPLIIEADLRKPSIADRYNLESTVGLTSILVGRVSLEATVQRTNGVDVVTSGPLPPNPTELLASTRMHELVQYSRQLYDFVVIDSPPLLPAADSSAISAYVDGVLFVARYGATKRVDARRAGDLLLRAGSEVVGVVLTLTPARPGGAYGYGYYGTYVTAAEDNRLGRPEDVTNEFERKPSPSRRSRL